MEGSPRIAWNHKDKFRFALRLSFPSVLLSLYDDKLPRLNIKSTGKREEREKRANIAGATEANGMKEAKRLEHTAMKADGKENLKIS
jgi:phosphoribosylaminoimidazole-succinocarboxamide synthase